MKTLNFKFQLKDLDGIEINSNEASANKILARILANDLGRNPIKFFTWATLIHKGEPISIDEQDLDLLKNFIIDNNTLSALTKSQLLEVIITQR